MERNANVFEKKTTPNEVILARVDCLVMEHNTYIQKVSKSSVPRHKSSANMWCASLLGVVKINSDASLVTGWGRSKWGLLLVMRNAK